MADESVVALGQRFQQLRGRPGKYGGGEYDEAIDSPEGEKFKVMKALGDQLGLPGTPAADLLARFGKPDELTPSLQSQGGGGAVPLMPGPTMDASAATGQQQQQPPYFLVYYWRQKSDYLYFKIDPIKETVITSDWNLAPDQ
ncbi:hypothetical protein BDB00DRAFT_811675 [Zychaea mexicana]|uniref:uncharacterized protein n=1 Tax=Zychaea mexicana TaxID=64656 RepID=UPI0022FE3350|nr:uncharacterized protein BDB00DRAFT_811675 [Zychaea mexicana]KAI9495776.1 hypothetical protein BDB00DRAFT_811675 [Zychaea mexicana]